MKRFWIILLLALAAAAALAYYWWTHHAATGDNSYQTVAVTRGDVQELILASGTLEPVNSVDVGAQVGGIIKSFGKDTNGNPIDFRSPVKGDPNDLPNSTILAIIDPTIYQADLDQANATLDSANANLLAAQANLIQDQAKLEDALADWTAAQALGAGESLAKTTYDSYKATYDTAKAQVDVGTAAISQAKAAVEQAQAQQSSAKRNLDFCTITSPVNGTVIDRRVDVGQTVVSSMSTPSLFLIATDLSKMQIWVPVNEADIPLIKEGMPVLFDVEGINREYQGTVNKVRWNATMTQNVVTYTVEVNADNPDGTLIPYRTANVKFLVNESKDVLLVSNAALRWHPRTTDTGAAAPAATSASPAGSGSNATAAGSGSGRGRKTKQSVVYVLDHGAPKAVPVQTGITDEVNTAVLGGDLKEGDAIITGQMVADQGGGSTTNPFAPTIFRGGARRNG